MQNDSDMRLAKETGRWKAACLATFTGLVTWIWYGTLPYHTFMGDDLWLLKSIKEGAITFTGSLTNTLFYKYRPVVYFVQSIQFHLLGDQFTAYVYFNIVFETINSLFAGYLAWRISAKKWSMAVAAALLMATARFAYYFVVQVNGFLEALSLFLFLLIILGAYLAFERKERKCLIWANVAFFLLIHTHERYVVVAGFLLMAPLLFPTALNLMSYASRGLFCALPLLTVAFNYLLKTSVLKIPFFVGTGGTYIGSNLRQIASHFKSSAINMLGFNAGPQHLSGLDYRQAGFYGLAFGVTITLCCAAILTFRVLENFPKNQPRRGISRGDIFAAVLFLSLLLSLLLAASVTVLVDFRWLYAPYAVCILGIAWLYGGINMYKTAARTVLCVFVAASLGASLYYRQHLDNVYFCYSMRCSDSAQTNIIDHYKHSVGEKDVYLNLGGRDDIKNWVLMNNIFFEYFAPDSDLNIHYVSGFDEILAGTKSNKSFFFVLKDNKFLDVTLQSRERMARKPVTVDYDFVMNFDKSRIKDDRAAATPNGKGVLKLKWPDAEGTPETFTIVSTFQSTFDNIPVKSGAVLTLVAGMPHGVGDGARLTVDMHSVDGKPSRILSTELPLSRNGLIRWRTFEVPLDPAARTDFAFTFAVDSPSGDQSGDWVAIREAKIVIPDVIQKDNK